MKTALYDSIVKIVEEETLKLDAIATPQFINALLELTWTQLGKSDSSHLWPPQGSCCSQSTLTKDHEMNPATDGH